VIQLKAPVIVVGCKLDLRDEQQVSLEQVMAPIMQSFREIETCIECSALRQIQVPPLILDWLFVPPKCLILTFVLSEHLSDTLE
jgi:GTPase SAR1 family protein